MPIEWVEGCGMGRTGAFIAAGVLLAALVGGCSRTTTGKADAEGLFLQPVAEATSAAAYADDAVHEREQAVESLVDD